MIAFILDEDDVHSATWKKLRTALEQRLDELRARNDRIMGPEETARLRGRIAEIKILLTLDSPAPALEADE